MTVTDPGKHNRRPRFGVPTDADIEAIIARLPFRTLARAVHRADYEGITVETLVRRRWAVCARALLGPTWGMGAIRTVTSKS